MSLRRVLILSLATAAISASVEAQGIPRNATVRQRPTAAATRIMVANPYVFAKNDSATAVAVGRAMRDRMNRLAPRTEFVVISDSLMNAALKQYDYSPDAILNRSDAQMLARQIAGRVLVTSQMSKAPSGQWSLLTRLSGTNDDAGTTVRIAATGGSPQTLGAAAVEALQPALKSLESARECMDQRAAKPDRAKQAAEKALKDMPNNGLAHYCLAQLAPAGPARIRALEATVAGDSLSVKALGELAAAHETAGDTAKTVLALQQMLRAAPTDQELRQRAFRYFLQSGRTKAAIEVADEGLALDPSNWDLYDLKSNACLFSSDFKCAVEVLEQAYAVDSTRADTLFFAKIGASADQRLSDTLPPATAADTANFVKWATLGYARYPNNLGTLQNRVKAFTYTGQVDSSVVATRQLLAVDSSAVTAALAAGQALFNAKRYEEGVAFTDIALARGDEQAKVQAAGLLLNAALPILRTQPSDFKTAADLLRKAVQGAPTAQFAPTANYLLGFATFQQVPVLDPQAERGKSCEIARQMEALLVESKAALTIGKQVQPVESDKFLGYVAQYEPRVATMVKAYCR
jgi:tetratricopeptide (TPR) repeat protein